VFTQDIFGWTSGNSAIAQVGTAKVKGVAAGQTYAQGESDPVYVGYGTNCVLKNLYPQATVRVSVPTSLKVLKVSVLQTGNGTNHGCLAGYYGIQVDVEYQVLDQQTPPQPIKDATMIPQEHVVFWDGSTKDGNIGPTYVTTTSKTTRADGTFDDAPVGACSAVPFNTPLTTTQDIKILTGGGTVYTVRHNDFKFSSTNLINHGTVTNGSDVTATQ
jgi:hypothetical protein